MKAIEKYFENNGLRFDVPFQAPMDSGEEAEHFRRMAQEVTWAVKDSGGRMD